MIIKQSQLPTNDLNNEWPVTLTPQQREQLIKEKFARAAATLQARNQRDTILGKNCTRSRQPG